MINLKKVFDTPIGEMSDGFHTFNELYDHRAKLFAVICNLFPERSWKSKFHHDGCMFHGMFIVGIDTPKGPACYHYDLYPYWGLFNNVKELDKAPIWDGHSPSEDLTRLLSLNDLNIVEVIDAINSKNLIDNGVIDYD